jgi:hypothetical protein
MSHKFKCGIVFIIAGLSLSGCAGYDRVLFVTKTNLGLDIDNKPPTAEVTIARRELAITPTFQNADGNENTLPLLASFALTGGFLNPEIISRFAGGEAAIILAQGPNKTAGRPFLCLTEKPEIRPLGKKMWHFLSRQDKEDARAFYFATDTSFGLKVGWDGATGPYPDTLKLGYNRKELAFPPIFATPATTKECPEEVAKDEVVAKEKVAKEKWKVTVPSFVASLDNSSTIKEIEEWSESGNTHIQFFATGKAATEFVKRADVNAAMNEKMYPHASFSIDPIVSIVAVSGTKVFKVTGVTGRATFTKMYDTTGAAEVDPSTGLYTAGPNSGTSIVGVADEAGKTAVATITVNPALTIAPVSQNVAHGNKFRLIATGGLEPHKFSISDNQSIGATIDEETGLYTAGNTAGTTDKVKVTDLSTPPVSIEATVNVQ